MKKAFVRKAKRVRPEEIAPATTRGSILEAARADFSEHGLEGARVDRIAQRAKINKAMIYYHFSSKEKLYEEVIREHFQSVTEQLRLNAEPEVDFGAALLKVAETHINMVQSRGEFLPIFLRELANPHDEFLEIVSGIIRNSGLPDIMKGKFASAMARGEFRELDLRQAIISFITMSLGYMLMAPVIDRVFGITDQDAFLEQRKHAIVDLFMNGVKAREV